jgi:hypothetical protein
MSNNISQLDGCRATVFAFCVSGWIRRAIAGSLILSAVLIWGLAHADDEHVFCPPEYTCAPSVLSAGEYPQEVPMWSPGRQPFDPGGGARVWYERGTRTAASEAEALNTGLDAAPFGSASNVNGRALVVRTAEGMYSGVFVPDGRGGYVWVGDARPMQLPDQRTEQGRELVLQIRDLADQLFASFSSQGEDAQLAVPTCFVNLDDFTSTSSLGRLMAEQMFYECNRRGMAVQEYRMTEDVTLLEQDGEFVLTRDGSLSANKISATQVILGTYSFGRDNIFINARVCDLENGRVLSAAMKVMPQNMVTRRMLAKGTGPDLSAVDIALRTRLNDRENSLYQ